MKIIEVTPTEKKENTIREHVYQNIQDYQLEDTILNLMQQFAALVETLAEKEILSLEDIVEITGTYKKLERIEEE